MTIHDLDDLEDADDLEPVLYPTPFPGNGYIYVLEFGNGTIKVGKTIELAARIRSHVGDAAVFGIDAERLWWSTDHRFYSVSERRLIAAVAKIATGRQRKEYFTGITYEQARDLARDITTGEINRRMDAAWRLADEGEVLNAIDVMANIGMDNETAMKLVDFHLAVEPVEEAVPA